MSAISFGFGGRDDFAGLGNFVNGDLLVLNALGIFFNILLIKIF